MKRKYHFDLPYRVSAFMVGPGIYRLQQEEIWDDLPAALRKRASDASDTWSSLTITREDCDSCSGPVWEKLADMLGLDWEEE